MCSVPLGIVQGNMVGIMIRHFDSQAQLFHQVWQEVQEEFTLRWLGVLHVVCYRFPDLGKSCWGQHRPIHTIVRCGLQDNELPHLRFFQNVLAIVLQEVGNVPIGDDVEHLAEE